MASTAPRMATPEMNVFTSSGGRQLWCGIKGSGGRDGGGSPGPVQSRDGVQVEGWTTRCRGYMWSFCILGLGRMRWMRRWRRWWWGSMRRDWVMDDARWSSFQLALCGPHRIQMKAEMTVAAIRSRSPTPQSSPHSRPLICTPTPPMKISTYIYASAAMQAQQCKRNNASAVHATSPPRRSLANVSAPEFASRCGSFGF